jgi:hypothetical protein
MKLRALISLWLLSGILSSCGEKPAKNGAGVIDEKLFYPVFTFVNRELNSIDSMDVALFTYRKKVQREDTTIMEKAEFRRYVESVFTPEMLAEPSKYAFERRIFMDETIGRVTISMDAGDPATSVRRMDMLLDPETDAIRSIYLESTKVEGTRTIQRKLTWTAGQQLSEGIVELNGDDTLTSRMRISWGIPQ